MKHRFNKHYSRDEARALLQVRNWLERLKQLRHNLGRHEKHRSALMKQGSDAGGGTVNRWVLTLAAMHEILAEFQRRRIFIKDLERGLVDFPAIVGEKEVFFFVGNRTRKTLNSATTSTLVLACANGGRLENSTAESV
jgi:hypothetical protein